MKNLKPRKTLAKEIKKFAQSKNVFQDFKAQEIATFGRLLTPSEDLVRMYYATKAEISNKMGGNKWWRHKVIIRRPGVKTLSTELGKITESALKKIKERLVNEMFAAIDGEDFEKIQELAEAVRYFKGRKRPHPRPLDFERETLLALKVSLGGHKITIREVASYLARKKSGSKQAPEIKTPADGFSALRKKCREINFPLASSRKISRT